MDAPFCLTGWPLIFTKGTLDFKILGVFNIITVQTNQYEINILQEQLQHTAWSSQFPNLSQGTLMYFCLPLYLLLAGPCYPVKMWYTYTLMFTLLCIRSCPF